MNNRDYQSLFCISSHWLISILESPANCWRKYIDPNKPFQETTDSMRFGTLVHLLMLTPNMFDNEIIVCDYDRRTLAGKEKYKSLLMTGKTIIKPAELQKAQAIVDVINNNPEAKKLLRFGSKEKTIIKHRNPGMLPLKARVDVLNKKQQLVVELKTIYYIGAIDYAISEYKYLLSAAFYNNITATNNFKFVFVQTTEPYGVVIKEITDDDMEIGQDQLNKSLTLFDSCWAKNYWPEKNENFYEIHDHDKYKSKYDQNREFAL
jgi:hypothetical protein